MSNNYDMAYFNREQSVVGKETLRRPYQIDPRRLGYRPRYPEEEGRPGTLDLVAEARRRAAEGTPATVA